MKALFLKQRYLKPSFKWTWLKVKGSAARPPDTKKVLGLVPVRFLWSQHVFSEPGGAPSSRPEPGTGTPHSPQVCRPPLTDSWRNKVGKVIAFPPSVHQKAARCSSEAGGTGLHRWTDSSWFLQYLIESKQTDYSALTHISPTTIQQTGAGETRVFLLARVFRAFRCWCSGAPEEFKLQMSLEMKYASLCSTERVRQQSSHPQTPRQQHCWSQELLFFTSTSLSLMLIPFFFFFLPQTGGGGAVRMPSADHGWLTAHRGRELA